MSADVQWKNQGVCGKKALRYYDGVMRVMSPLAAKVMDNEILRDKGKLIRINENWVTPAQLAAVVGVTRSSIYKRLERGKSLSDPRYRHSPRSAL